MKLSDDFLCRVVCGETLLIPVGEKTKDYNGIFTFTGTGAFLLNALHEGMSEDAAAKALADEFETDIDTAKADTREFFNQLAQFGILIE